MDNSARRNGEKRTGSRVLGAVAVSEGLLSPSLWSHLQMPPQWCHSARRSVEKSSGISQGRTQFSSRKEEKVGSRRKRMKTRTQELFLSWINHPPKQLPRQFFLFILSWNGGENSVKCSSFAFNLKLKAQLVKKKEKSWKYTARTKFLKRLETRTVAHSLRDFRPAIVCAIAWVDSILCVCVCVLHQLLLASRRNVISPIPPVRFCVSSDIYRFLSYSIQYGYIHKNQSSFSFFKKETWTSIEIRTLAIFTSFRNCSLSSSYFREEKQ